MSKTVHILETGFSRHDQIENWDKIDFQVLVDLHETLKEMDSDERDEYMGDSDLTEDHYWLHDVVSNYYVPGEEYSLGDVVKALSKNDGFCVPGEEVNICLGRTKKTAAAANVTEDFDDDDDWDEE